MNPNPRSVTEAERPWLEAWSLDTQARLIELVRARRSNVVAFGLVGWLTAKHAGLEDLTAAGQRSNYRKVLAELADQGLSPDPVTASNGARSLRTSSRRRRAESGAAQVAMAVGGATGMLAFTGHPWVALVAAPVMCEPVKLQVVDQSDDLQRARRRARRPTLHVPHTFTPGDATRVEHVLEAA